ncbi:MAG: enoyl-CoA hydratase-related protein, partial [SAR324 cluster bacterium]|nr:enoyl-CoA hydratase-related protein [SAR324 cluster bacterium]
YLSALNGTAAGGGYEMALATEHIMLVDDSSSTVSLPEVPLLAVLPGTGGLTRVVDKRKVRRDHADFFCTVSEGIRGKRALEWKLVDELVPRSKFRETVEERAQEIAARTQEKKELQGIPLTAIDPQIDPDQIRYSHLLLKLDRKRGCVDFHIQGPNEKLPESIEELHQMGDQYWLFALGRELDDAILHLSFNEPELGTWVFHTEGNLSNVVDYEQFLIDQSDDWLAREIILFLKRVLKRIDLSARSLISLIEPGSCFAGFLLELVLASDRSYMLEGSFEDSEEPAPVIIPTSMNFGSLPMCNGLTRLETRFYNQQEDLEKIQSSLGKPLDAEQALDLGLVTFIPDDIDWEDEVRLAIEERSSFSPDALTGMEASLRFPGPETLETKIFGRLSAWQNWIFQRPNAVGEEGALKLYGTGKQANYAKERV